jgi:nicotinamide-nucleotide amidase
MTQTTEVEIISIGNELLIGKILNTNAQYIAKQATNLGTTITRTTTVLDDIDTIATALQEAINRKPQFIITTGGLGPTFDDKTLQGIAKALNQKLTVDPTALNMVKQKYEFYAKTKTAEANIELTKPRIKMATIPEKTTPIRNPIGTAPAIQAETNGTTIFVLPGVPREMEAIFQETIAPILRQAAKGASFYEKSLYAEEIMESNLAPLIDIVMQDNQGIYIKSHPKGEENKPHIEIHLSTTTADNEGAKEKLEAAANQLSSLITRTHGKVSTQNLLETEYSN